LRTSPQRLLITRWSVKLCFTKKTELVASMLKSHLITAGGTVVGTAIISAVSRDDVSHEAALSHAILAFQANGWVHGDARAPNVVRRRDNKGMLIDFAWSKVSDLREERLADFGTYVCSVLGVRIDEDMRWWGCLNRYKSIVENIDGLYSV
jgi:tRNA A-37 threonylcarbamoyl transferase component Bud32